MAKRKMQRAGNEKNYDYYFLLCSQKKSRPLGLALHLPLSLSLLLLLLLARMRYPFELAGVIARCKRSELPLLLLVLPLLLLFSYLLFLPVSPPAVAIMHYYYPARLCRADPSCADSVPCTALRIHLFFPTEN